MKRKYAIGTSLLILGMIGCGLAVSIAWFAPEENTFNADVNGSVVEEYFHSGNGTQGSPFVITRPMHYYHLVEFFQRKTEYGNVTFGTTYLYFQIGADLDGDSSNGLEVYTYNNDGSYADSYGKTLNMAYFSGDNALMPIGTSECPFFGTFKGGGDRTSSKRITITNLNIKSSEEVVMHGGGTTKTTRYTSDVGMFGYVADKGPNNEATVIEDLFVDNLTIDLTGAAKGKNELNQSVTHVTAHDDKVHVGYIVGHLHEYSNYNSTGSVNAKPLHDVYVNNAKIVGGYDGANCSFGYVGYADKIDGVAGTEYDLAKRIKDLEAASGGGTGNDWGGSLAFDDFNRRIHSQVQSGSSVRFKNGNTTYNKGLIKAYSDSYSSFAAFRGGTSTAAETYLSKDPMTNYVVYNLIGSGTHSIWTGSSRTGTQYTASSAVDGTIQPLLMDEGATSANNTGYLVSSQYTQNASQKHYFTTIDGTIRSASYPNGQIANSIVDQRKELSDLYNADTGGPKFTYNGNNLEILTNAGVNYSDGFCLISDDYNANHTVTNSTLTSYTKTSYSTRGLTKYKNARDTLESVLTNSQYVHGIHFMGETVNASKTASVGNAIINGESINNYPVLLSSIDFNLKEKGEITLFAGTYYPADATTTVDSFFDLYTVTRNQSTHAITNAQKIYKIYQDNTTNEYYYALTANQTFNNSTLVFDLSFLTSTPPKNNVLYYFQIPVNSGEFAIGAASGKTSGAYLMYLDIGTSGSDSQSTTDQQNKISTEPIFTQIEYLSSGYVINSCFNIGFVVPADSNKDNFSVKVTRTPKENDQNVTDIFNVEIVNATTHDVTIYILLVDNNSNNDDAYPYRYKLTYNGTTDPTEHGSSEAWKGTSGGTAMTKLVLNSSS